MTALEQETPPVLAAGEWANNAELIADVARLGYLDGHVLDPTHGKGRFWKIWTPAELTACDLNPNKSPLGRPVDFTDLPWPDATFDAVTLDGPYKLNGTASGPSDDDYGVDAPRSREERHQLILDGITECHRVLRPGGYLLVKCQDQVNGGKVRWQTRIFADHAEGLGSRLVDSFLFPSYRPQSRPQQVHARRNYSTLLVLQKDRGFGRAVPQLFEDLRAGQAVSA